MTAHIKVENHSSCTQAILDIDVYKGLSGLVNINIKEIIGIITRPRTTINSVDSIVFLSFSFIFLPFNRNIQDYTLKMFLFGEKIVKKC